MTIRAYITFGPHIGLEASNNRGSISYHHKAFSEIVLDPETDPNISVSNTLHLLDQIPPQLENVVRYWSLHERINARCEYTNRRAIGKYYLGNAEAQVSESHENPNQDIRVTGPDLKECAKLSEMILAGTIPANIPYGVPQVTSRVLRVREALHQLIESIAVAFDGFRHRRLQ